MEYIEINIESKKYGNVKALIDVDDYERLKKDFKNLKWCVSKSRNDLYIQKRINKTKKIFLHRYIVNAQKGEYVDHINRNTLDNRKMNLRVVSNSDNLRNGNLRKNNGTGVKGVYFDKSRNKYCAEIKVRYKKIFLGRFDTLEEAKKVRESAEIKF